ncbi:MAG TPA: DUF2878 domain-containing protein [Methylophilaceae bacterium]|nr:DUF2878 domain-containing protein [Methylophilaceae bacterium]
MLVNIIGFQLGWFACVLGAAYGYPLLGPVVALPVIGWHLARQADKGMELRLLLLTVLIGSAFDQSLMLLDLVRYSANLWQADWLPIWMMTLWALFATTLNVSLRWLERRPAIAILFGLIGGPLAYWGGARLGAIQWQQPIALLIALAIGWAVLMPVLGKLASTLRARSLTAGALHV